MAGETELKERVQGLTVSLSKWPILGGKAKYVVYVSSSDVSKFGYVIVSKRDAEMLSELFGLKISEM